MDLVAENARLRAALERWQSYGCPDCSGDCGSANPPMLSCVMQETAAALATPATAAVQEAARVLLSLMKPTDWYQASHAMSDAEGGVRSQDERRLSAALRAIAGDRT